MKTYLIRQLSFGLAAILSLAFLEKVDAQTFQVLHDFNGIDGASPESALILTGDKLWGTAYAGGSCTNGTLFSVGIDGTGFAKCHDFSSLVTISNQIIIPPGSIPVTVYTYTNSDGANPAAGLVLGSNTVYGTASAGGSGGKGTIFSVNINGTGFTTLHHFSGSGGATPVAGLILSGGTLYGTASSGGSGNNGCVYSINTNGTGFTVLHNFSAGKYNGPVATNYDGANPKASLILSGNILYGTSYAGGSSGAGTVFALATDGTGFTTLHNFTGSDGSGPYGSLVLLSNVLYGTTRDGGQWTDGTIFAVNTNATGFTNLYSFTGWISNFVDNADGAQPLAGLTSLNDMLYGTTSTYGSPGSGTAVAIKTDGSGFTVLHRFLTAEGDSPCASLLFVGTTLFGSAFNGGNSNYGTLFRLSMPLPELNITRSGTNIILSWPTNNSGIDYSGFTLQSTTNFSAPVWSPAVTAPAFFNGEYVVTNRFTDAQKLYRLMQ